MSGFSSEDPDYTGGLLNKDRCRKRATAPMQLPLLASNSFEPHLTVLAFKPLPAQYTAAG